MKKVIFSFLLNILVFSFVFSLFEGINLPSDVGYMLLVYTALAIAFMLQKPLLKFLTVKNNLLTYWLSASIMGIGALFLLITVVPGLTVGQTVIKESVYGAVTVSAMNLDSNLTMVISLLLAGLISGIMEGLKKPTEE